MMTLVNIVRSRSLMVTLVVAVGIVAVGITSTTVFKRRSQRSHPPAARRLIQTPVPADEVALSLFPDGFAEKEVRAQRRRFLLSLDNRTDAKDLVLRLSGADGKQVRELHVPGGGGDWGEMFDLQPGSYTFAEVNHADWWCTIVVD